MKLAFASLGIGIAIGAIVIAAPIAFMLAFPRPSDTHIQSFVIGGYLVDMSENNTLTISQSVREDWLKHEEVRLLDIKIIGGVVYGCGWPRTDASPVKECSTRVRSGEIPLGTEICAHVSLIEGELRGDKIFIDGRSRACDFPRVAS